MTKAEMLITIFWGNDCGEVICEETLPAKDVFELIQTDFRAEYNVYVLPDGTEFDSFEFYEWFTSDILETV